MTGTNTEMPITNLTSQIIRYCQAMWHAHRGSAWPANCAIVWSDSLLCSAIPLLKFIRDATSASSPNDIVFADDRRAFRSVCAHHIIDLGSWTAFNRSAILPRSNYSHRWRRKVVKRLPIDEDRVVLHRTPLSRARRELRMSRADAQGNQASNSGIWVLML
jgi:hypothetical protein